MQYAQNTPAFPEGFCGAYIQISFFPPAILSLGSFQHYCPFFILVFFKNIGFLKYSKKIPGLFLKNSFSALYSWRGYFLF
jgi:hypothetical protein